MSPLNLKLLRDIAHLRGQVLAITVVVACGIATYVTMRSAYGSLTHVQAEYYAAYRFADVFAHVKRAPESLRPLIAAIPGVAEVQTRVLVDVSVDIRGLDQPATARLVSVPAHGRPSLNGLVIRSGRYLEPSQRAEVIMSEAFAEANGLRPGDSISAIINGRWERFHIAGTALSPEYVYEVRPGEVMPDNRRFGVLWIARETIGPAFNMDGAFNNVVVALGRGAVEQEVIARLDQLLDKFGSLGAYGRADHISWRIVDDHIEEIRTSGMILPSIFLGVVAFLVNILMSRLVSTQRGQIAVMRAFGYTRTEIAVHYLLMAMVTVAAGTVVGIGVGLWLGSGLTALFGRYFRFPDLVLQPDARVMLAASAISAAAASAGAISAVLRAAALAPAEAMRPEPPASFKQGWIERTGLRLFLSPAMRMLVRNLTRRPLRALLSALAVGCSVAILVVGWYRIDAVNQLAHIQFGHVQREDITVVFHEPRPDSAVFDLARLPGVLRVEPFRDTPVRLRFGNRMRRTAITGLTPGGLLRRPLTAELEPVDLPPGGLLLNDRLASTLGVRPGDRLTVEVLEGERLVRQVPVSRLVDEPIGLNAYMDIASVARLLREGPSISGAFLRVDPAASTRLYSMLKRTPAVAGVAVRDVIMASFWSTIGDSIKSTTVVLIWFASVIAFGIVYNGARIALSERGNELASLRVLGFTRVEIGGILLGEQAVLTVLSIPLGFAGGYGLSYWIATTHSPDLLRLPFVVDERTYGISALVVVVAAALSGLVVAHRLQRMDLTAVLKSRE